MMPSTAFVIISFPSAAAAKRGQGRFQNAGKCSTILRLDNQHLLLRLRERS